MSWVDAYEEFHTDCTVKRMVMYAHVSQPRAQDRIAWLTPDSSEGPFECRNVTIQNNDIGPCGSEQFQEVSHGRQAHADPR